MRRYTPLKPSRGTRWPPEVVAAAYALHGGCMGPAAGMPEPCYGAIEPDHIRASGAVGMKSRSTLDNCAPLCSAHHRLKTNEGRTWRPLLIDLVNQRLGLSCAHVEPVRGCPACPQLADPYVVGMGS